MDPIMDIIAYITQLDLEDIESLQERSRHKLESTLSDEELAMLLFVEEAEGLLNITKGHRAASVPQSGSLLQELMEREELERYDHQVALAISEDRPIPPPPGRRSISITDNYLYSPEEPPEDFENDSDESDTSSTMFSDDRSMYASSSHTELDEFGEGPSSSSHSTHKDETSYCTICCDDISGTAITAPCGHVYDTGCMEAMFSKASTDETLYPPRCCLMPIPPADVEQHISPQIMMQFHTRSREFDTPLGSRVYCCRPRCSAYIGATTPEPSSMPCSSPECSAVTCGSCKQEAHPDAHCTNQQELEELALGQMATELHKEKGWQRCYSCHHMVEKSDGCYHMTCICKAQFCYLCATKWKECDCPQFEIPPDLIVL